MLEWIIASSLGFAAGFAACWFYRNKVEAAVVTVNKVSAEVSSAVDAAKKIV